MEALCQLSYSPVLRTGHVTTTGSWRSATQSGEGALRRRAHGPVAAGQTDTSMIHATGRPTAPAISDRDLLSQELARLG